MEKYRIALFMLALFLGLGCASLPWGANPPTQTECPQLACAPCPPTPTPFAGQNWAQGAWSPAVGMDSAMIVITDRSVYLVERDQPGIVTETYYHISSADWQGGFLRLVAEQSLQNGQKLRYESAEMILRFEEQKGQLHFVIEPYGAGVPEVGSAGWVRR